MRASSNNCGRLSQKTKVLHNLCTVLGGLATRVLRLLLSGPSALLPSLERADGRHQDSMLDCIGAAQLDGSTAPFVPPPRQQLLGAVQAFRFMDSQIAFKPDDA